jgi:hypothetical protein
MTFHKSEHNEATCLGINKNHTTFALREVI